MALDSFRFTMSLPADANLLPLVREVSGHMVRYLGLPEEEAREARDMLEDVLSSRLEHLGPGAGPIHVEFERPYTADTVTVQVTSASLPDDPTSTDESDIARTSENGHSRIRWSWRVHDGK